MCVARMGLPSWRLQSFLGCISVQQGTFIIGFFTVLRSLLETTRGIKMLYDTELHVIQCRNSARTTFQEDYSDPEGSMKDVCPMVFIFRCIFVIKIIVMFINFLLTVVMLHGARQKKPKLMAPWLWWQLCFVLLMILAIFNLGHFPTIMINLFLLMINVYIFLVVNSHYLELIENARLSNMMMLTVDRPSLRPRTEMHITIPSPLKDDPPPPYPGPTSVTNLAYYPHYDPNLPAPPYTPYPIGDSTTPPPPYPVDTAPSASVHQEETEPQNHQVPKPSADTGSDPPADESGSEAAPLVDRPSMPQK